MTFLNDIQNFFVKNEKKKIIIIWFKLSQTYGSIISFAYFETFFLKTPMLKNFPLKEDTSLLQGKVLPPPIQKLHIILL